MGNVELTKTNHVAVITFSDEKGMNILNSDILQKLETTFDILAKDDEVYCIVLCGGGEKAFAAGADVAEMNGYDAQSCRAYIVKGSRLFRKIEMFRVPVIAAVNGFALGGGCELAMACDIRIASESAVFGQPEVTLGIIPGWGATQRMAKIIGVGRAKELIFSGRMVKAEEAVAIGLANRVVPKEKFMGETMILAETIAQKAPVAVRAAKLVINTSFWDKLDGGLAEEASLFGKCFSTEDRRNAFQAFLGKKTLNVFNNR